MNNFNIENKDFSLVDFTPTKYIIDRYKFISDLGSGADGFVVKVKDTEENIECALKITLFNEDRSKMYEFYKELESLSIGSIAKEPDSENKFREVINFSKFLKLHNYTKSIIRPYNWAVIDDYRLFSSFFENTLENDCDEKIRAIIITMPIMQHHLKHLLISLTLQEKRDMLFELIMLFICFLPLNLYHGDFHFDNIMVTETDQARVYKIGGNNYVVKSKYLPVCIDPGLIKNYEKPDLNFLKGKNGDQISKYYKENPDVENKIRKYKSYTIKRANEWKVLARMFKDVIAESEYNIMLKGDPCIVYYFNNLKCENLDKVENACIFENCENLFNR